MSRGRARPTRGSAADQGVRPTKKRGGGGGKKKPHARKAWSMKFYYNLSRRMTDQHDASTCGTQKQCKCRSNLRVFPATRKLAQLFHDLFQSLPGGPGFGLGQGSYRHVHEVEVVDKSGLRGVHI